MATRQLVCEGQCNGGLVQEFDAAIRLHGRMTFESGEASRGAVETSAAPQAVLDLARTFIYTPHREDSIGYATCTVCGSRRRWGNRLTD